MYRVFFSDFGYFAMHDFSNINVAKEYVKRKGFDAVIYCGNEPVAYYGIFSGFRS